MKSKKYLNACKIQSEKYLNVEECIMNYTVASFIWYKSEHYYCTSTLVLVTKQKGGHI